MHIICMQSNGAAITLSDSGRMYAGTYPAASSSAGFQNFESGTSVVLTSLCLCYVVTL